jgi:tetratricopeptide (TPR) repeat protein
MSSSLQNAIQLYDFRKYDLALKEVNNLLSENPEEARAYSLKALIFMQKGKTADAFENAQKAITLSPDDAYTYYVTGLVHLNFTKNYKEAEKLFKEAIRIDPEDPDYYDVMAKIKIAEDKNKEALKFCEKGLKLNPRDVELLSTQARVLVNLGRREEAFVSLERALKDDPENSQILAVAGLIHLQIGNQPEALTFFTEALRINPNNEFARDGLVEGLKTKNFFFRQYLRYVFWYGRFGKGVRWVMLLCIPLLVSLLTKIPVLTPLIILYGLFALSGWLMDPIYNMFLRFDKYGKYALRKGISVATVFTAIFVLLAICTAIVAFAISLPQLAIGAAALFLLIIPISKTGYLFKESRGKYWTSLSLTIFFLAIVLFGFWIFLFEKAAGVLLFGLGIGGEILYTWFATMFNL